MLPGPVPPPRSTDSARAPTGPSGQGVETEKSGVSNPKGVPEPLPGAARAPLRDRRYASSVRHWRHSWLVSLVVATLHQDISGYLGIEQHAPARKAIRPLGNILHANFLKSQAEPFG